MQKKHPTKPAGVAGRRVRAPGADPSQAAAVPRDVLDAISSRSVAPRRSPSPSPAADTGACPMCRHTLLDCLLWKYLIFALIALLLLATVGVTLVWGLSVLCRFLAVLVEQFSTSPRAR